MTLPPVPALSTRSRSIECGAAAPDRGHTTGLEPEDHRLVDETLDRVWDGQVDDQDAVGRVLERRDEDLPARVVAVLSGPEWACIGEPGSAGDQEGEVGAGGVAEPDGVGAPNLGEQPFGDRRQIWWGQRELAASSAASTNPRKRPRPPWRSVVSFSLERSEASSPLGSCWREKRTSACRAPSSIAAGTWEGALSRPEVELGLGARVARGGEEL